MRRAINLPRQKRSDLVVEEIKRWIVAEGKKPGDRLPQERDLIAIFGVSKGTVRESLKSLEVQGLIKLKRGRMGEQRYFQRVLRGYGRTTRELLLFTEIGAKEIYSLRKLIEPELAQAALYHLTAEQVSRLEQTVLLCEEKPTDQEHVRKQRLAELRVPQHPGRRLPQCHALVYVQIHQPLPRGNGDLQRSLRWASGSYQK